MDVAVVGGGVIGLLSALRLAQRGHQVCVMERGEPGAEATWAAAGILGAQSEAHARDPMLELCLRSRSLYPALADELGDIGFLPCGALRLAFTDAEAAALREQHAWQIAAGLQAELVPHASARVALWLPGDGVVDNRKLAQSLRAAVARAGVRILRARAMRLRFLGDALRGVETEEAGFVPAPIAVIAAGAWSAEIEGARIPSSAVMPVRGQMIAYAAPPPASVIFGGGGYAVPRRELTLIGATVEHAGFDRSTTAEGLAQLRAVAALLVPALASAQPADHWAGLRPGSRDGLPLLGRARPGVFVATGHFRNGILLAPATAELVVRLVEGTGSAPAAFDPRRFRPTT